MILLAFLCIALEATKSGMLPNDEAVPAAIKIRPVVVLELSVLLLLYSRFDLSPRMSTVPATASPAPPVSRMMPPVLKCLLFAIYSSADLF